MINLTEEVKNLTVHMTQFENLSATALKLIEGNPPPSIEVQTAIKVISEGKDTSKVTKATLIKLVEYLFDEFDLKKNDLKVISSAKVVTNSSPKEDISYTQPVPSQEETTETYYSISTTETQTTRSKKKQLRPKLLTKEGIYDTQ